MEQPGAATAPPPRADRCALVLLSIHAALLVVLAFATKLTTDEPNYLLAGSALRHHLDWQAYNTILHGPLAFFPNQLGALFGLDPLADLDAYRGIGRLGFVPFAVLAAVAVWRLARDASGVVTARFALALWTLNPLTLGHGCLMTADMALTCGYTWTLWAAWRFLHAPGWGALVRLGVLLGLTLATKYLALFLLPVLGGAALWSVAVRGARPALLLSRATTAGVARRLADLAVAVAVVAACATVVLHTCYLWGPGGYRVRGPAAEAHPSPEDPSWGPKSRDFQTIAALPGGEAALRLLPDPWIRGIDYQKLLAETGTTWFGDRIGPGFAGYFAVALAVKLPLAILLALAAGLLVLAAGRAPPVPRHLPPLLLLGAAVPLVYLSSFTTLQIGVRYALPAVPLLCLPAAAALASAWRAGAAGRAAALAAIGWLVACLAWDWPRYVGAFNLLARERPYLWFRDSNLDWRVGFLPDRDQEVMRARHPQARPANRFTGPALGAFLIHGPELCPVDPRSDPSARTRPIHHWLRRFHPADRLGAWFLFVIDEAAFRAAVGAGGADPDPRGLTELAFALLGEGRAADALAAVEGCADPDAATVRRMAQMAGTGDAAELAEGYLSIGRPDLVLAVPGEVPAFTRARAEFATGQMQAAVDSLEPRRAAGTMTAAEGDLLASALAELGRARAALAVLDDIPPPADQAGRELHERIVRRYRQLVDDLEHAERQGGVPPRR